MDYPVLTTKECEECGYVFLRYLDHGAVANPFKPKREQKVCLTCRVPRFVVVKRHPGEKL